ncbi:NAD-glutamate dehydrogenase [Embleya sp. NPDC005971]|uniref:NAD-glutamate dehydrogenase n=1 Tax=unclassified Embleya TaxID=2699296 RepID=UPI0033FD8CF2
MQSKLDEAKAELLARAAEAARAASSQHGGGGPEGPNRVDLDVLLSRYYRHTAPDDLIDRDPVDVYGAAISHCRLAAERPQGTARVRAYTPTVEENGWASGHTVVEVVTDDMPFLVDSVTNELSRQERSIHVVIHPQLIVRRTIAGELLEIVDTTDAHGVPEDAIIESWMHIEIDRESDREDLRSVEAGLQRIIRDVREVVEDWAKMRDTSLRLADELASDPPAALPEEEIGEAWELLRWLSEDHFTFLGYREYDLVCEDDEDVLRAVPGTGLGILRADQDLSASFSRLSTQARAKAREKQLLILTKANSRATVHRSAYLDYIGVKKFDAAGNVVGERRFLGLFSSAAYTDSVQRIPVVRRKVHAVLDKAGFPPVSHDGRDLLQILETYPRDDLFQIAVDELHDIVISVLYLQERRRLRLFLRKDEYGRFYSALVYLPRDRYTTEVRLKMQDILLAELAGSVVDYTARNTESVLARLHFTVRVPTGAELGDPDVDYIERLLAEATRSWIDDFGEALVAECGEESAAELSRRYAHAFSEGYKSDFPPRTAVADLKRIEELTPEADFKLHLYEPIGALPGERRFKIYRSGGHVSLSEVLPILQRMGLEVVDERPYELRRADGTVAWVYDFGLRYDATSMYGQPEDVKELFQDAFSATWTGRAENDGFNALVFRAGLTWRQAMVLRAYAKYQRQAGTTFGQEYIEDVLVSNPHTTRLLVNLFEARFSPGHQQAGTELVDGIVEAIEGALDQVASLDEDRILRSFLAMVKATLRTNFFQHREDGEAHDYLSLKFDPQEIPDLPAPRPRFEIFVYSPRVEGVHLRFGAVARGGLRWSDRREDFRTEILGLVKAQMVKNTVIVPVGAKGGFFCKQLPDASDREAWLAEGIACYRTFIGALLDITDNLVDGAVVPPADVVRHDADDTYLVVAADKGTATFSDIANEVAQAYGFWLGDAFASGGSAGYDHKGMGITARGAWESVKRHFRELGHDTQTEDFTVVGIGDMSGDVFGNGMLLSEHIRLVAAFDHRHIFLDPNPDAAASFAERRRLFDLPRSSWADYDKELISAGGGVYPRTAKSVPISAPVRQALGLPAGMIRLTPADLMKAILKAPADLFWNGGIGTYIKSSGESHADVGDKANDAIRVNGADLRVKVVGEGGNLGCTQLGRVEFALAGGRINTDAIDNSAGVDTSDHEVNIKILLNQVTAAGDMTLKQRNELLAAMTDEVGHLVLAANYGQNCALSNAVSQAGSLLHVHMRYMRRLVRDGHLDREIEFLPTDRQLRERQQNGQAMTQPELAVLLAYTKIVMAQDLIASDLPDDPFLARELYRYFPSALRARFVEQMDRHPLRRDIITTVVVNEVVNLAGLSFMFRMREESGASAEEVARAHITAREIFGVDRIMGAIAALDNKVPAEMQTTLRLHSRRLIERATRWFLGSRREIDIAAQVEFFRDGVAEVVAHLPKVLRGSDLAWMDGLYEEFTGAGVPTELATAVAGMSSAYAALDIVEVARDSERAVLDVAQVYFDIADRLPIAYLLDRIIELPRSDRWKSMARASLREDLYAAQAGLTAEVLGSGDPDDSPELRFKAWEHKNAPVLTRARSTLDELQEAENYDLATLSVAMRTIRTLLRTGSKS